MRILHGDGIPELRSVRDQGPPRLARGVQADLPVMQWKWQGAHSPFTSPHHHPLCRLVPTSRVSPPLPSSQVMCTSCLCTGLAMATEHDPRIDPFD